MPPIASRPSIIANRFLGDDVRRWYAAATPESPAPTIRTSKLSVEPSDSITAVDDCISNDCFPRMKRCTRTFLIRQTVLSTWGNLLLGSRHSSLPHEAAGGLNAASAIAAAAA